ncbi:MAG TPA: hypothetical protein VEP29_05235 [Desulfatiglandales bacterium]|nr:hypothetical protein [Desulfatiglandales bacterium]
MVHVQVLVKAGLSAPACGGFGLDSGLDMHPVRHHEIDAKE